MQKNTASSRTSCQMTAGGCATGGVRSSNVRLRGNREAANTAGRCLPFCAALGGLERIDLLGRYGFNLDTVLIGRQQACRI